MDYFTGMQIKLFWPGKTQNENLRGLEAFYLKRISTMENCEIVQTKAAKGFSEKEAARIKKMESEGLEKRMGDEYIICLSDSGRQLDSKEFALELTKWSDLNRGRVAFVVGGFLGLDDRLLRKADFLLSLSQMTFSHELARIVLMEQIYRALTILKGKKYAK
jgi:23S rRNA (pseudouridine1915-N3)-methyltransferase